MARSLIIEAFFKQGGDQDFFTPHTSGQFFPLGIFLFHLRVKIAGHPLVGI
jgi:hypothetical protein